MKLINILIRTSNRPVLFTRALRSVTRQTHKNIRIIVSYDTPQRPSYIPATIEAIAVTKTEEKYCYNLYCNDLKDQVTDGWFMYLDDDDYLAGSTVIASLASRLVSDKATICQFGRGSRIKPKKNGEIVSGGIGMPCIVLHHSLKDAGTFGSSSNADYEFIAEVCQKVGYNFTPIVVVRADRRSYGVTDKPRSKNTPG